MNAPVALYQFTPDTRAAFAEMDEVRLVSDARTKYGQPLSAGAEGTILSVYAEGAAYIVEFDQGIATIEAEHLIAAG